MKTTKLFTLALGALLLAGCSSDAIDDPGSGSNSGFNNEGTGYLRVSINLPTQANQAAISRANDVTGDGDATEYDVKNATILLFGGSSETDATLQGAYDFPWSGDMDVDNDHITTQMTQTLKIGAIEGNIKYALAVLNRNNILTLTPNANGVGYTPYINKNGESTDISKYTLKQITQMLVNSEEDFMSNGFFMTNAVLTTTSGAGTTSSESGTSTNDATTPTATVLSEINNKYIYATEEEAQNGNVAVDVIVERAVAKVSLSGTNSSTTTTSTTGNTSNTFTIGNGTQSLTYEIKGFALANKNASSFLIRNWGGASQNESAVTNGADAWLKLASDGNEFATDDAKSTWNANKYRFAGSTPIKISTQSITNVGSDPTPTSYRTYWGIDPNYSTELTATANPTTIADDMNPKYCLENTFDVANQTVENTTCAIVKVHCTPTSTNSNSTTFSSFYTVNRNSDKLYDEAGMKNLVLNTLQLNYGKDLKEALMSSVKSSESTNSSYTYDIDYGTGTVTFDEADKTKIATLSVTAKVNENGTDKTYVLTVGNNATTYKESPTGETAANLTSDVTLTCVQTIFKKNYAPQYYNVGSDNSGFDCYYVVRIKHFGDDLTPWATSINGTAKDEAYPKGSNRDANYLGRYGVLRNNWYDISVTGIEKLGMAEVPNPGHDSDNYDVKKTDDELDSYMKFRISVLSWAKRVQGVKLK